MSHNVGGTYGRLPCPTESGLSIDYRIAYKIAMGLVVTRLPCAVGVYVQKGWMYPAQT